MTGLFIRFEGKSRELESLTDEELTKWATSMSERREDGWSWVVSLTKWIRDNVKEGPPTSTIGSSASDIGG